MGNRWLPCGPGGWHLFPQRWVDEAKDHKEADSLPNGKREPGERRPLCQGIGNGVRWVRIQDYGASWTPGIVWFSSAVAVDFSSLASSSEDRFLFSAINLLTPTIHWLTSVTWSTMSERWMSSAVSHWWLESSEEREEVNQQLGAKDLALSPLIPTISSSSAIHDKVRELGYMERPTHTLHQQSHPLLHRHWQLPSNPLFPQQSQASADVITYLLLRDRSPSKSALLAQQGRGKAAPNRK